MQEGFATASDTDGFLDQVASFGEFGTATEVSTRDGIPYLENQFWTSGQRRAHPLQEVSYRGCFKPQLPEFFISRLTLPGQAVLDPFMGRGTAPLQAALMGRRPVGNDVNPLSRMLVGPRLNPPSQASVADRLAAVDWGLQAECPADLLAFYHPATLSALCALRLRLLEKDRAGSLDGVDGWIRMVALNRLSGHSPGYLSGYTLPPNQAVSVASQLRINERLGLLPPERDVPALLLRRTRSLLKSGGPPMHPAAILSVGPADNLGGVGDGTVALAVTSPPFLDVIDYAEDNWLRCWFAGIGATSVAVSIHKDTDAWISMVRGALAEMARTLSPGGHVAFEVGEVRGGRVLLERLVWQAAEGTALERVAVIVNRQSFSKTANLWGVSNGSKGTNTNRVVLLRKN